MRFFDVNLGKIGKNSSRARCKGANLQGSDYGFSCVNGDTGKVEKIVSNELEVEVTVLPLIERFSFAFTANGKRQAAACRKSKKIILF